MLKRWLIVSAAVVVAGCGSSPTAPTPAAFHQTVSGTVEAGLANIQPLTIPRNGTMTIALTWPEPDLDPHLYLASAPCEPGQCHIYDVDAGPNGNSRKLTRTVTNGETFQIIVNNLLSPGAAHYTVDIDIR